MSPSGVIPSLAQRREGIASTQGCQNPARSPTDALLAGDDNLFLKKGADRFYAARTRAKNSIVS